MVRIFTNYALFILTALFSISFSIHVSAQVFTPIVGNYQCGQFPNGAEFLVRTTTTGFELVKKSDVQALFSKERKILTQRLNLINDLLDGFKQSRISTGKLISGANKVLAKLFGDDALPKELPPGEAEVRVFALRKRIIDRDSVLKTIGDLIDNCGGLNVKKGKGSPVGVTVQPISIASSREIFGGFLIYAPKIKNQFSRKPTGFNVCLKLIYPDGTEGKLYTGFGDSGLCGTGTLKFEGVAPSVCDALLPKGQAGWVVPKRSYAFTALPDATTEQLLDRIRLEVIPDQPIVGVMAFPVTLSRDASVKACEAF